MDINTNFYEFIPEITGDNEIQRELRSIIKQAIGMFESCDNLTQVLIDDIKALISTSRESAFNALSRQRRTNRKGAAAQHAIDELGTRILDVLRPTTAIFSVFGSLDKDMFLFCSLCSTEKIALPLEKIIQ